MQTGERENEEKERRTPPGTTTVNVDANGDFHHDHETSQSLDDPLKRSDSITQTNSSNSNTWSSSSPVHATRKDVAESRTILSGDHTGSRSNRVEYCLTILDNAIQFFIDDDEDDDKSLGDEDAVGGDDARTRGVKPVQDANEMDRILVIRKKGSKLLQKVIRKAAKVEFDVHNIQHRNTLFLIITTISVVPLTRILCLFILQKLLYLFLTTLGTTIGIAMGVIIGMHSYQLISSQNEETEEDDDYATSLKFDDKNRSRHISVGSISTGPVGSGASMSNSQSSNPHLSVKNSASSNTYSALMAAAGYDVHTLAGNAAAYINPNATKVMHQRGQILRNVDDSTKESFSFVKDPLSRKSIYRNATPTILNTNGNANSHGSYRSKGLTMFQRLFPRLPHIVQKELGELIDFVTRDYVISWYHIVDDAVGYENEKLRRERLQSISGPTLDRDDDANHNETNTKESNVSNHSSRNANNLMILSTTPTRTIPFLEIFYTALTTLLGNLSTTCETINVPHLILYKFMDILKVNIRTFKDIRKIVLKKEAQKKKRKGRKRLSIINVGTRSVHGDESGDSDCNSDDAKGKSMEMAIVREYLLQGKLHRAVTFGLDVPGLLFGDAKGKECPIPDTHTDINIESVPSSTLPPKDGDESNEIIDEDAILEQRLFGNGRRILHECEVDYNRVLSHRLCKILFPRPDFASPVLRSASIELLASMILTPIMACFNPDYMNGWIIKGLSGSSDKVDEDEKELADGSSGEDMLSSEDDLEEGLDEEELDVALDVGDSLDEADSFDEGASGSHVDTHSLGDTNISDEILALLAMSLIELQAHIDFDDARDAKSSGVELDIRWNDQGCIETVRNLVLVIEAMLMHGVLLQKRKKRTNISPSEIVTENDAFSIEEDSSVKRKDFTSLITLLMEMTSDLEAFESDIANEAVGTSDAENLYEEDIGDLNSIPRPKIGDLSTLRTLIAAWLHTGVAYRTLSVLMHSSSSLLYPFYHNGAFIRKQENIDGFLRQLRGLKNVDILVDTMTILSHPPLDLYKLDAKDSTNSGSRSPTNSSRSDCHNDNNTAKSMKSEPQSKTQNKNGLGLSIKTNFENNRKRLTRLVRPGEILRQSSPTSRAEISPTSKKDFLSVAFGSSTQNQSYLEFRRNEALATSLRSEREARLSSFEKLKNDYMKNKKVVVETICRSKFAPNEYFLEHRDLHNLAKGFYSNTTSLSLRHVYTDSNEVKCEESSGNDKRPETILMMETVATRRKWAIPDEDSSFLLRAQPVKLNVVGIHRDQRSHNLSYKKYAAYFDEPIAQVDANEFRGARLRRKCFLRYYPSDRTASINFTKNDNKLDCNLGRMLQIETSGSLRELKEFDRYLCNKSSREGSERTGGALSNSILASTVMDSNDFNSVPRSGKSQDFVYRASLFEEPEVELSGKKFIVEDAASVGAHRADASSLEISDAALSTALVLGQSYDKKQNQQFHVKCGDFQIPSIFLKLVDQSVDPGSPLSSSYKKKSQNGEFREYKLSLVRAALLVVSARKEAQLKVRKYNDNILFPLFSTLTFISVAQCLLSLSPKQVTKSRTDKLLQPTLTLLDFATSGQREKQAILLRDLKLGNNHIDKDQLRRSGILSPRYPTNLRSLKVVIDGAVESKSNQGLDLLGGPGNILYKLRCIAITEYISVDGGSDGIEYGTLMREEWTVLRSFKDFTTFHKFLKTQVNSTESSANTGAKLTGLATAALTLGTMPHSEMKRKALIPSLHKAVQAGALGATKKCIEKRKEILNEYLTHLLSKRNLLNRCPELLRFVGAYDPLPESVALGAGVVPDFTDGLGRFEMNKSHLQQGNKVNDSPKSFQNRSHPSPSLSIITDSKQDLVALKTESDPKLKMNEKRKSKKQVDPARLAIIASIKSRVDRVKLSKVRGSVFELIRYMFDLDSANFFRSQMVTALKTMSMAISGHGFKRTLIELHLKYLSSRSIASYIKFVKDLMWPNGVIFTSATPLTPEESRDVAKKSRILLQEKFPDQLQAVLGTDITENGLDLFHEMLNNRLVLKSMIYMMADTLLLEAFPEMRDILTCAQSLNS